ncbi:MAG TPA: ASKHA domain-containing protein [Nitrospirota bacterium]|nr:ASKHA domain-containing protein [Nitrospirota bacterium]
MISLIFQRNITLPLPSDVDRRAHDQRIRDALGLAQLDIPLGVLRKTSSLLFEGRTLTCIVGRIENAYRLIDVGKERSYSIALDLGTTNLVGQLYDNISQRDVLVKSIGNPQVAYGSDIITRMQYSMTDHADDDVARVLKDGINGLIEALCREAGIDARDIHAMTVAGNTVMSHYFLGLDISTIPVNPFVPVVRTPGFLRASELSLAMNPEAIVYVFPNAGSYVGGDITAGIIASGMFQSEKISILIDVGTNAEIVIGNREWMIVGAGAAGPALEEGISRIGKRAQKGIIYEVEIRGSDILCKTFDDATPEGICGSGMVSLLYELYKAGIIDKSGALKPAGKQVIDLDGEKAFAIACTCEDFLYIKQSEIQNFMKSKAAMFTLLLVLTRSVGIAFRDIASVYVSGALGTGINAEKAVGIGMLPAWPPEIVRPLGNSSLTGARMLLANGDLASAASEIVARITYKHMNDDPEFMKEYLGAVFIPHTNPELLRTE